MGRVSVRGGGGEEYEEDRGRHEHLRGMHSAWQSWTVLQKRRDIADGRFFLEVPVKLVPETGVVKSRVVKVFFQLVPLFGVRALLWLGEMAERPSTRISAGIAVGGKSKKKGAPIVQPELGPPAGIGYGAGPGSMNLPPPPPTLSDVSRSSDTQLVCLRCIHAGHLISLSFSRRAVVAGFAEGARSLQEGRAGLKKGSRSQGCAD